MKSRTKVLLPVTLLLVSALAISASAAPAAKDVAGKKSAPASSVQAKGYRPCEGTGPFHPGDGTGYGAKKNLGAGTCIPLGDQIRRMTGKK